MRLRVLLRLLEIQRVFVKHELVEFIAASNLYRPFRFFVYLSPWVWFQHRNGQSRGERLRLALEELGPIFVKFGQALSTRRDMLTLDIADELAKQQDRVPPFDSAIAMATVETALGQSIKDVFASFEAAPLAAASIAQVHAARLKSGQEVVVKILRPDMHEVIARDPRPVRWRRGSPMPAHWYEKSVTLPRGSRAISQHLSNISRSCARPRCTRDFIPDTEMPTISAASRAVRPSSSTRVTASRYGDGSCATNIVTQPDSERAASRSSSSSASAACSVSISARCSRRSQPLGYATRAESARSRPRR